MGIPFFSCNYWKICRYISLWHINSGPPVSSDMWYQTHLSTVATCEQNQDCSWGDGGTELPLMLAEGLLPVALQLAGYVLSGVVPGLQAGRQEKFFYPLKNPVMFATDIQRNTYTEATHFFTFASNTAKLSPDMKLWTHGHTWGGQTPESDCISQRAILCKYRGSVNLLNHHLIKSCLTLQFQGMKHPDREWA